jgi:tetratricopeptide (TPR) repeat protein
MRTFLLACGFSWVAVLGTAQKNNDQLSQAELEKRAFEQLESGKEDPSEAALLILQKAGNKPSKYVINANTILGIVHKNRGHYISALEYYIKALDASEQLGDEGRVSASLNNIGIMYVLQENYSKAIYYFNRSLKIEEKLNQPLQKSIRLFNLGDCYKELEQYDEALGYYTNSLLIEKKEKNKTGVVYAELGMADVYTHTNRLTDAKVTLKQVKDHLADADLEAELLFYKLSGEIAMAENRFADAESALKKAEQFSWKHDLKNQLPDIYELLAQLYSTNNHSDKAVAYYRKYIEIAEQLQNNFVKNQLEDLTYQNKLKRKQLQIQYLKEQQTLAEKNAKAMRELRNYDWKIMIFSVIALLSVITVVFIGVRKLVQLNK